MDYSQSGTYYRTALLLGVIHGEAVHRWAEEVIERDTHPPPAFFEIVSASVNDLSELRHALFPLVVEPPPAPILHAILGLLDADLASGRRGLADTLTVLRQMRSMLRLPPPLYADLNAALVEHAGRTEGGTIEAWLQQFAKPDAASQLR